MNRTRSLSPQARAVLLALRARPAEWRHGYDLMQATGLKSGTLYPVLMRLADRGLLEAEWHAPVPPARAPRHAYRLTADGLAAARALGDAAAPARSGFGGLPA